MTRTQAFGLVQQCSLHYPCHPILRKQVQQWKEIQRGCIIKISVWEQIIHLLSEALFQESPQTLKKDDKCQCLQRTAPRYFHL